MTQHSTNPADLRVIEALLTIMRRLRDPDGGCPWDLEQSFETIAPYTIEEAYEVASAIAHGTQTRDYSELKDELGDLLLQVVFHAQMAEERGFFAFPDVIEAICRKMLRRHPHVFGEGAAKNAAQVSQNWEAIKRAERGTKTGSVLSDVPSALPALIRAIKLQNRAASVGFDWPSAINVAEKIAEEAQELAEADAKADPGEIAEEFGDLLFALANLGRHLRVDPEAALRSANDKFVRRFRAIEADLAADGRRPEESSLEEMEVLWQKAKDAERKRG
jgi:MazG family protein